MPKRRVELLYAALDSGIVFLLRAPHLPGDRQYHLSDSTDLPCRVECLDCLCNGGLVVSGKVHRLQL